MSVSSCQSASQSLRSSPRFDPMDTARPRRSSVYLWLVSLPLSSGLGWDTCNMPRSISLHPPAHTDRQTDTYIPLKVGSRSDVSVVVCHHPRNHPPTPPFPSPPPPRSGNRTAAKTLTHGQQLRPQDQHGIIEVRAKTHLCGQRQLSPTLHPTPKPEERQCSARWPCAKLARTRPSSSAQCLTSKPSAMS